MHLSGVASCQLTGADPNAVLQSHADVDTHRSGHGGNRKLPASCAQDRPAVIPAKEPISSALHVHHILGVCPNSAKDAKHRLNEEGPLYQPTVEKIRQVIEVTNVVTLEFKTSAVTRTGP